MSSREHILEKASQLFAKKGFAETSVRDICEEAEVNVSSVNYYFGSKAGLYKSVCIHSSQTIFQIIAKATQKSNTPMELFESVFEGILKNADDVLNGFKIFLNSQMKPEEILEINPDCGPPGMSEIKNYLQQFYPQTPEKELLWIIRVLLDQLFLKALFIKKMNLKKAPQGWYTKEQFKTDWFKLVETLLEKFN